MASVFGVLLPASIDWGACVRDAATGDVLAEHGPDRVLPAASMGKLLLLETVARTLDGPQCSLAYAVLARFDDARRDEVLAVMRELGAAMQHRCQAPMLRQAGSATQAVPSRSKPSRP
jgi:hypothetical protein